MHVWTRALVIGLVMGAAAPGSAADRSVGVGLGFVDAGDVGSTFWLTANVNLKAGKDLILQPEFGYWKKSESELGVDASARDINVGATVLYAFSAKPRSKARFSAGAGLGLHLLKGSVGVLDILEESESESKIGIHLLGNVDYDASRSLVVFGAVRYDVVSDLNQLKVYAGVRFGL